MEFLKRFSLSLNGCLIGAFATLGEALTGLEKCSNVSGIATIWDHEDNEEIVSQIIM